MQLREPVHTILPIGGKGETDVEMGEKMRRVAGEVAEGRGGGKVFLKWED